MKIVVLCSLVFVISCFQHIPGRRLKIGLEYSLHSHEPRSVQDETKEQLSKQLKQLIASTIIVQCIGKPEQMRTNAVSETIDGARGFEAAESAFSPMQSLNAIPILPQSALLNSLPLENKLVGQLQGFLESFAQLVRPNARQRAQISTNDSALWRNLKINAQRAAGMLFYNEKKLNPIVFSKESSEIQSLRIQYCDIYLDELRRNVLLLVNASRSYSVPLSLRYMRDSLNSLHNVAYMQVPLYETEQFNSTSSQSDDYARDQRLAEQLAQSPRLLGRAIVKLTFRRPAALPFMPGLPISGEPVLEGNEELGRRQEVAEVTIAVDGLHHPYAAGNFIDLCMKEFYDGLQVASQSIDFSPTSSAQQVVNFTILGLSDDGFIDPATKQQRRIPLEVYREGDNGTRFTAVGGARNSAVFVKSFPIFSFATYGALGMMHEKGDSNGASASFFWLPLDHSSRNPQQLNQLPAIQRMNNKYSLFAYVIEGNDVLAQLRAGDVLESAKVTEGVWKLITPDSTTGSSS